MGMLLDTRATWGQPGELPEPGEEGLVTSEKEERAKELTEVLKERDERALQKERKQLESRKVAGATAQGPDPAREVSDGTVYTSSRKVTQVGLS